MAKVTMTVATVLASFPATTVGGKMRFILSSNAVPAVPPVTQDVDDLLAVFPDVADGDYTGSAQRLDSAGVFLGDPVTAPLTVSTAAAPTTVQIPVPAANGLTFKVEA